MGKAAGWHPLVAMFTLILGAPCGVSGMTMAVPLVSHCQVRIPEGHWLPLKNAASGHATAVTH
jgi:hypothetical protein